MRAVGLAVLLGVASAWSGNGPADAAPTWPEAKCVRYRQAWTALLAHRGSGGLRPDFLDANAAFMASGCTEGGGVCPRTGDEIEVANAMTVVAMNFGTASTFLPFGCRPPAAPTARP